MLRFKKSAVVLFMFLLIVAGCGEAANTNPNNEGSQESKAPINNGEIELLTGSATYSGRIDNISIEVMISSVPKEQSYRAFELSQDLQESFHLYGIETGDQVIFNYYEPVIDGKRPVIVEINRIGNNQ